MKGFEGISSSEKEYDWLIVFSSHFLRASILLFSWLL